MFSIGEAVVIEEEVAHARFACDLQRCKGACCTMPGGRGAPLDDAELPELERAYPAIRHSLSQKSLRAIAAQGLYEGAPGSYATVCIEERDCVFVIYDERDGAAKCAIEKAHLEGAISWRKPLSCHLFPIRISPCGNSEQMRYEQIPECAAGRARGEKRDRPLYDYLEIPLVRKYGQQWYDRFRAACRHRELFRAAR